MKRNLRIDRKTHCNAESNHREADSTAFSGRRRGGSIWRAVLAVCTAGLLSFCFVVSPLAPGMRVLAVDNSDDWKTLGPGTAWGTNTGQSVTVDNGATLQINAGSISVNRGTITSNYGIVDENKGKIDLNGYNQPGYGPGNVRINNGVIGEHQYGTVHTNSKNATINVMKGGEVRQNEGTIKSFISGTVTDNFGTVGSFFNSNNAYPSTPVIITNHAGAVIEKCGSYQNYMTARVELNEGTINEIGKRGTVEINAGKILTNKGHVEYNTGHIKDNQGTVVYNLGGTISGGNGSAYVYFLVEIAETNATAAYDQTSFKNVQNKNYLEQGKSGTITITPAAGYRIDSIDLKNTGATAVKNADGSWTITVNNIQNNIGTGDWSILTSAVLNVTPVSLQLQWSFPVTFTVGTSPAPAPKPAANTAEETKENFDSVYYADNNPDVFEAYGYDHDLLWNHYVTYGKAENRKARFVEGIHKNTDRSVGSDVSEEKDNFNAITYADYYADVKAVYGYDGEALWAHYDTFGRAEGRLYFAK